MPTHVIGALQIGSQPTGKADTLQLILSYEDEVKAKGVELLVLPEALLGGYPKGQVFGTYLGYRLPEGREAFLKYFNNAVDLDGDEVKALEGFSARTGAFLIIGVIERANTTLYCTALFIDPLQGLVGKHRKLMPTATERLIWGQGDGSTLTVVDTKTVGKVSAAICWENYMPLLRYTLYAKGISIYCAPTVDSREIWQCTMRHIATEGRCFVISACQVQDSPSALGLKPDEVPGWPADTKLMQGNSLIASPMGEVLAGPLVGEQGLVTAAVDLDDVVRGRYDLDVTGHYARGDVFDLKVNETSSAAVKFQ